MPYDGGKSISAYKVYWDAGSGSSDESSFVPANPATAPANVSPQVQIQIGIIAGETYQFKVLATNEIGDGSFSTVTSFIAAEVPSEPRSVAKASADATQITVTWL